MASQSDDDNALRPWRRAAREAGVSLRQLRGAIERGEVPAWVVGGWTRVRPADVLAWLGTCRRGASVGVNEPVA